MLPKELDDLFDEYTSDDYLLYVTRVEDITDNFIIDFALDVQNINDKGAIFQRWRIEAVGHRKNHVSFDFAPFIDIKADHPLLWEFTDTQCQLYYNGQCDEPTKVFYDLFMAHKQAFGKYHCFDISFFEDTAYFKPFQYSNGLLTEGSKKLMVQYGGCLERNGLAYSIISEREPKYWNGEQYIQESKNLKILFMGKTYIIAEDFFFTKQEENSR